jgi:Zn-dependent protease
MEYATLFSLIVLFLSISLHEFSHGAMAYFLGDPTAKEEGRLTLNPLKHIDPFGTILLPLFLIVANFPVVFGWAKPVPVNPFYFKNPKSDMVKVALAGPFSNYFVAILFAIFYKFFGLEYFYLISIYNFLLGTFNLFPIPPLDGSWFLNLLPEKFSNLKSFIFQWGILILILFLVFGLEIVYRISVFLFKFFSGT